MQQLLLDLGPPPAPTLDNFVVGANAAVLASLRAAAAGNGETLPGGGHALARVAVATGPVVISRIGAGGRGNEVVGANRQGLTDVTHLLVPTTGTLYEYRDSLRCGIGGLAPFAKGGPQFSGIITSSGLTLGVERYRYPGDLPKVAASSGGRSFCKELGLPELPPNFTPPMLVADIGSNPNKYGNAGILLNSEGLKNWLFGPLDGPPRNSAQIGQPG